MRAGLGGPFEVLGYSRVGLRWPHGRLRTPVGGPSRHWGGVRKNRSKFAIAVEDASTYVSHFQLYLI
jgi:hypothetical protein